MVAGSAEDKVVESLVKFPKSKFEEEKLDETGMMKDALLDNSTW